MNLNFCVAIEWICNANEIISSWETKSFHMMVLPVLDHLYAFLDLRGFGTL